MTEIWKGVVGYEGYYEVSTLGQVRSLTIQVRNRHGFRPRYGRILKTQRHQGYRTVALSIKSDQRRFKVSILVAMAFLPNPNGLPLVSHKNDIRDDDKVRNLEWSDHASNMERMVENEHSCKGTRNGMAILTEKDIPIIRERLEAGERPKEIAPDYRVAESTIWNIKRDTRWCHV